jgi:ElaB/YqjD/DUF883 family membrane-anchored ribosome-binding protein
MIRGDERSLSDLREGAERTRAELTDTVDQLRSKVSDTVTDFRERMSPDAVKTQMGEYFRARGEVLLDKARDNPLQTAAIGAVLAYPVLGIVRSIPAPILLVGAGLFLLGANSGQNASRRMGAIADDLSDQIRVGAVAARKNLQGAQDVAMDNLASARAGISASVENLKRQSSEVGAALSEGAAKLSDTSANAVRAATSGLGDLKQTAMDAVGVASDGLRENAASASSAMRGAASDAVGATSDAVRGTVESTSSALRSVAGNAAELGSDAAHEVRDRVVRTSQNTASTIAATIQQNPLLVGGIGLAIGMLVAGVLPRSAVEDGIMGEGNAGVQKRASDLAARGFQAAKDVATGVAGDLADQADREGLTPTGLSAAAQDLGRRVRKVAENATETAFELSTETARGDAR